MAITNFVHFCYLQLWTSDANQDGDDDREGENN